MRNKTKLPQAKLEVLLKYEHSLHIDGQILYNIYINSEINQLDTV